MVLRRRNGLKQLRIVEVWRNQNDTRKFPRRA